MCLGELKNNNINPTVITLFLCSCTYTLVCEETRTQLQKNSNKCFLLQPLIHGAYPLCTPFFSWCLRHGSVGSSSFLKQIPSGVYSCITLSLFLNIFKDLQDLVTQQLRQSQKQNQSQHLLPLQELLSYSF